jgi:hypothetical protein
MLVHLAKYTPALRLRRRSPMRTSSRCVPEAQHRAEDMHERCRHAFRPSRSAAVPKSLFWKECKVLTGQENHQLDGNESWTGYDVIVVRSRARASSSCSVTAQKTRWLAKVPPLPFSSTIKDMEGLQHNG